MGRFDFRSPGGQLNRSLQDALYKQEHARQQAFWNELEASSKMAAMARAENEARRAEALAKQQDADRTAGILGPQADLNPEAAATLRAGGYQVTDRQTLPSRSLDMPTGDGGPIVPGVDMPSTSYSRRAETYAEQLAREQREAAQREKDEGRQFRNEQAEADRAFRGEQASANRDAAAERAQADRDMKLLIADMTRSGSAETRALGNELKRLQIQAAQDKLDNGSGGTEGQRRTEGLLSRAQAARQTIDTIEPTIGAWDTSVPSWAQSTAGQQYGQAAKQWIQSVLRDESGAAIGAEEEASYFRTYFRQPGDSAAVIQQKQQARSAAEAAMQQKVGRSRSSGNSGGSDTSKPRRRRYDPVSGTLK